MKLFHSQGTTHPNWGIRWTLPRIESTGIIQEGPGIVKHDHRSVLSKVALEVELTIYISRDLAFFGKIRLDFIDNTCTHPYKSHCPYPKNFIEKREKAMREYL